MGKNVWRDHGARIVRANSGRPYLLSAVILVGIGILAWCNHRDFVRLMLNQAQSQIILIDQIQAESLEYRIVSIEDDLAKLSSQDTTRSFFNHPKDLKEKSSEILSEALAYIGDLLKNIYVVDTRGEMIAHAGTPTLLKGEQLEPVFSQGKISIITKKSLREQFLLIEEPILKDQELIGAVRAEIPMANLSKLIERINRIPKAYSLVLDQDLAIINHIFQEYNNQKLASVFQGQGAREIKSALNCIQEQAHSGRTGVCFIEFPSEKRSSRLVKTIAAITPMHIHNQEWFLAVFWEYHAIVGPILRNGAYNIILVIFSIFLFAWLTTVILRARRKVWDLEVQEIVSKIIAKQMRADLERHKRKQTP